MNGSNAFSYLIGTLLDLYIAAVLFRLLLQWVRADFYNPVCQFLVKVTNPAIVPLRRVIPSIKKLDTASVVLILALEFFSVWIASRIGSSPLGLEQIVIFSIKKLFATLLMTYFFLIIAAVIISWVGARMRHPVIPLVYQLTEPVLAPFRKIIPPIAGIDLTPLFALITIRFLLLLIGW
ncbi:MAG: YggT family protein [Xanthomonadales bacterium]|nr:YggT family protein [Gammaproteobacteria bacterium]MBT8055131.1 YggT family protein [Gammaproteobacteria bacterium]NND58380.1 YggT family protein [Xanthomonadales bacterium]NNK51725.1 YggT family protein [Xanthomonadales bacterium]